MNHGYCHLCRTVFLNEDEIPPILKRKLCEVKEKLNKLFWMTELVVITESCS